MNAAPPSPNRRSFLRSTSLAAAAATATGAVSAPLAGRAADAEKTELGFVGLNERGLALLRDVLATRRVTVTWLCDVDAAALQRAEAILKEHQVRPAKSVADFHRALEDRRLQAVVLATPDHWHALATLRALRAGKAVYVEKPLAHTPREGELVVEAQRRSRLPVQVGLQRRSLPWIRDAIRRLHEREIGDVRFARAWFAGHRPRVGFGQLAPVPAGLDYTLWQGPAPTRPFRDNVLPAAWRWFWHWGSGELGATGIDYLDLARWGLRLECPDRVASGGGRLHFDDDQETPDTQVVSFDFPGVTLAWEHRSCLPAPLDGESAGVTFYGTQGTLTIADRQYHVLDAQGRETARVRGDLTTAPHLENFLDAVENHAKPLAASAEDGHLSTLLAHLGNIALRAGETLRLNPKTRQLREARGAAQFWSRDYQPGFNPAA